MILWNFNMAKLEKHLQKQCIDYLKSKGIYYINQFGHGWGAKGAPDLICCINGMFVAFELKIKGNTMQPDQQIHKNRIQKNKGRHYCPTSIKEFIENINEIKIGRCK